MTGFAISARSERRLEGVNRDLVAVVRRAAMMADREFVVTEGLRAKERQLQLVKAGASKTMNSRHLTGHAVDLAATVCGKIRWDWPLYYQIAETMRDAAVDLSVRVVWGSVWDRSLNDLSGVLDDDVAGYVARCKMRNKKPFLDGPHFELDRIIYP